ncbi:hypothetical protein [Pantoea sp. B65]|uniref:hypothetical protein n=1 Tax=Pantoea sp. B65 TaxID=2813359 RepID=UPI0039B577AF
MRRCLFPLLPLLLSATGAAGAETLPESLIHCDSRFFSELYIQQSKFKHVAPLTTDSQHHAWFVAPKDRGNTVWFAQPVAVQQLTLSGYYSQQDDLAEMGKYYFWGLVIDQSVEAVIKAMPNVNWKKVNDEYFAVAMIKRPGEQVWQKNETAVSGIAPAKGSVEKLAMLSVRNGKTQLLCSVQGSVTKEVLLPLRPDLIAGKK